MKSDDRPADNKELSALTELGNLPKIPKIGFIPFGFGGDIGLGFAHNFALDIAKEVLRELSKEQLAELYKGITKILNQWKNEHGRLYSSSNSLLGLLGGKPEPEKQLSETDRLAQIKSLEPWQCHEIATTPIGLFNQLSYDEYKPLKEYMDGQSWQKYHSLQALLIILSHNSESEYQTSDCIYEGMKLALWHLQYKKGLVDIMMPDAMAMWKARQKSKTVRGAKKKQKELEVDAKVIAAYRSFCKDGKPPSAIQQSIQKETKLNQTEVSRSMTRQGLSTRKKKRFAETTLEYS